MFTHHTSNGCDLRPGDLLGSGTVSGPDPAARGCLLEITRGGVEPILLPDGTQRTFLEDGDEVTLRAFCQCDWSRAYRFWRMPRNSDRRPLNHIPCIFFFKL